MDIHRPKAAHNIREFLTEIGTIICGILIALGLEQGIEAIHWAEKVHTANEQINAEVGAIYTYARERVQFGRQIGSFQASTPMPGSGCCSGRARKGG